MQKGEIRIKKVGGNIFIQELNPETGKFKKMARSPIEREANEPIIVDLYQRLLAEGYQQETITE